MRAVFLGVALSVLGLVIGFQALQQGSPAEASFHDMRIYGVMGGKGDTASAQFVELRMASGGQNQVQNAQLCFYDADGVPWARFVFPSKVDISASQSSVLVGSGAMSAEWQAGGAPPDFIFGAANTTALNGSADVNAPIPVPAGAIVYESKADAGCGSPSPIDSIAYGTSYNGVAFFGDVFEVDLPIAGASGFQLTTTPVVFPPDDNSTEYALQDCIVARNNAGASGTVGTACGPSPTPVTATPFVPTPTAPNPTETPGPTETAQATATPTPGASVVQGDADCDDDADEFDGLAIIKMIAGLGFVPCFQVANVDCSTGTEVDPTDMLLIVEFVADLFEPINDCTPIGEEVLR